MRTIDNGGQWWFLCWIPEEMDENDAWKIKDNAAEYAAKLFVMRHDSYYGESTDFAEVSVKTLPDGEVEVYEVSSETVIEYRARLKQ